jgi:hypothetical protein
MGVVTVWKAIRDGGALSCGKAKLTVKYEGDEVALARFSGKASVRSWASLGLSLRSAALRWDEGDWMVCAFEDGTVARGSMDLSPVLARVSKRRGAVVVEVSGSEGDPDAPLEVRLRAGVVELGVTGSGHAGPEELWAVGALLYSLVSLGRETMGMISAEALETHARAFFASAGPLDDGSDDEEEP